MSSPALLLVPLLWAAGAAPLPSTPGARADIHDVRLERDTVRYWTPARMARASGAEPSSTALTAGAVWRGGGAVRDASGKVFFTLGGRDYVCSGSTIASSSRDLVITAGHCAKDGAGEWAANWIFVPGYRDGGGPSGGFPARRMFVPPAWSQSGKDDEDVAIVAVSPSGGRHVTDAAGALPIAFGTPRGQQVYAFGYPATGAYDGEHLAYCAAREHDDPHHETGGQGLRCDMTQGSSGGPWLTAFNPSTGRGTVVSVSSFKYSDDATTMYGPYFGPAVRSLYGQATRG